MLTPKRKHSLVTCPAAPAESAPPRAVAFLEDRVRPPRGAPPPAGVCRYRPIQYVALTWNTFVGRVRKIRVRALSKSKSPAGASPDRVCVHTK